MTRMITMKTVQNIIGRRKKEIHKGDCGRILVAAGSHGMAGAAILAARSALRAGSGLVRTAIPAELFPVVQVGVPEATCIERKLPIQNLSDFDAVCIGPGLGETKESIDFVKELLTSYEKTLIVDADGLNIVAHQNLFDFLRRRAELYPERTILTPHMGEAKRLLATAVSNAPPAFTDLGMGLAAAPDANCWENCAAAPVSSINPSMPAAPSAEPELSTVVPVEDIPTTDADTDFDFSSAANAAERGRIADALVRKTRAIIVLKGAGTLVAAEGRPTYTNTTGNPGMATAGSGDVLSGIITSLAGQRSQIGTALADTKPAVQPAAQATVGMAFAETSPGGVEANSTVVKTVSAAKKDTSIAGETAPAPCTQPAAVSAVCKPARIGAFEAALAGVYIHGLAGDLAAAELGEYGVTAGDLAHYTAYAMKKILSEV